MIDGQLVDVGRLEGGKAVLRHADQRRADRLVRAALRRQRDAGRRADHHEARVLVAGVVQRIEAAADERDRTACRPAAAARRTASATAPAPTSIRNRFISAMPSSKCWPLGLISHFCGDSSPRCLNTSSWLAMREQAAPVDPGPEVGRDGDVGRGGDDAIGQRPAGSRDLVEHAAEAGLRRHLALGLDLGERHRRERVRPSAAAALGARTAPAAGTPRSRPAAARARRTGPIPRPG